MSEGLGQQGLLAFILLAMLAAFASGRWRYDVIAIAGLLATVAIGLVPAERAFAGFGSEAVVTVAAVLVLTATLSSSSSIDRLTRSLLTRVTTPTGQLAVLCGLAAGVSAFMNNIGALALFMPVALGIARRNGSSPGALLLPLSYATLLGGMVTLIGTPPNLMISQFHADATSHGFSFLAFTPVGLPLAILGVLYLVWRGHRTDKADSGKTTAGNDNADPCPADPVFSVVFDTELTVTPASPLIGQAAGIILEQGGTTLHSMVRDGRRLPGVIESEPLQAGDILLVRGSAESLAALTGHQGLTTPVHPEGGEDAVLAEVIVAPNALIQGSCAASLELPERHGVTLAAAARQSRRGDGRLDELTLSVGDVLLLHGPADAVRNAMVELGCLPLADRGLSLSPQGTPWLPAAVFAVAVLTAATGLVAPGVAFVGGVLALVAGRSLSPGTLYRAVDWPVIVLLGAMIPLGEALHDSGLAATVAEALVGLTGARDSWSAVEALGLTLAATMALTPFLNNPATVAVMAPIALDVGTRFGLPPDAFLMAVAVGASCDFLTPFGHHNNALVMGPGGYRFGDFARLGWGLELLILLAGTGLIWAVWL